MKYKLFTKNGLENDALTKAVKDAIEKEPRLISDSNPEIAIIVGGDGTFLAAVQELFPKNKETKFLCFNGGTIGFYNDFTIDDVDDISKIIFENKYSLGYIDALEAIIGNEHYFALNEFNITGLNKNIDYDVYLDSDYLEHFFGAGIIVSTPNGSPAYNRSLGGAIIDQSLHLMELTEVAGIHSKAYKSIGNTLVVSENRSFTFKANSIRVGYLYADGIKTTNLPLNEFKITYSKNKVLSYVKKDDYFVNRLHKSIDL